MTNIPTDRQNALWRGSKNIPKPPLLHWSQKVQVTASANTEKQQQKLSKSGFQARNKYNLGMEGEATTTAIQSAAEAAHEGGIHVALAAQRLGEYMGIPITNTLVTTWFIVGIIIVLAVLLSGR